MSPTRTAAIVLSALIMLSTPLVAHAHYAPQLGRFLQPDPSGHVDGPNVYAYVGNSPARYRDGAGRQKTEGTGSGDPFFDDGLLPDDSLSSNVDGRTWEPIDPDTFVGEPNEACCCTPDTCELRAYLRDWEIWGGGPLVLYENKVDWVVAAKWKVDVVLVKTGGGPEVDPSLCTVIATYIYKQWKHEEYTYWYKGLGRVNNVGTQYVEEPGGFTWEDGATDAQQTRCRFLGWDGEAWVLESNAIRISFSTKQTFSGIPGVGISMHYEQHGYSNVLMLGNRLFEPEPDAK